jgi:putative ABC transport system permease protein
MHARDLLRLTAGSVLMQRLRSQLTALGIAIGIAAVVLLTSIGEGIHQYVLAEFTQFGTNLIGINPGKATIHGASMGMFGTERPLTIEDAEALQRVPYVRKVVPVMQGNARVRGGGRSRRTTVYGVGPDMPEAFRLKVAIGRFLPADDPNSPRSLAVLGSKMRQELFGNRNPLGEHIRVGDNRFVIIGVMESKGQLLGFDLDDTVFLPTARALELFNRDSLMEIDVLYAEGAPEDEVVAGISRILKARHGRDDVTITTQKQMLDVLGAVLDILTLAVGAIGGISLLVGSVGILTIMTIAVTERTPEIGLLRALGATRAQILALFLGEAIVLAVTGGLAGLALGVGGAQVMHIALPALPVHTPWSYVAVAIALALVIGLLSGVLPARRAARLDPVEALRAE